jgi:SAM-dependent methyltransferase
MDLAQRISTFNRHRKWRLFQQHVRPGPQTRVLDVGFSEREYMAVDNYIEKHYPWPANLTALGIHEAITFQQRYPQVRTVRYDGRVFPFADGAFDVVWSNAVIEHVGDFDQQVHYLKEMVRVGRQVFFSTPNRGFPIELHTRLPLVHWLPKPACDRILRRVGKGFAAGAYMHLLTRRALQRVLCAAGVARARIIPNRLLGWPMDFVVHIGTPDAAQEDPAP